MLQRLSSQRCDRGLGASCSPSCAAMPGNVPLYVRRGQDRGPTLSSHKHLSNRRLVVSGASLELVDAMSQLASHLPLEQIAAPCQVMKCGDIVYRRQAVRRKNLMGVMLHAGFVVCVGV